MHAYVHVSLDKYYTNIQRPGKGSVSTKTLNSDYSTGKGYFSFSQIIFWLQLLFCGTIFSPRLHIH